MTPVDVFVTWRERALDRLLGVRGDALNTVHELPVPVDPARVAAEPKQLINELVAAVAQPNGDRVDYAGLVGSSSYRQYRAQSASLVKLDMTQLASREARLALWINLYNALVIDAVITLRVRRSVTEGRLGVLAFFRRAAYVIAGQRFSCDDIEHGILRENRGHPLIPGPQFAPADPRVAFVIQPPDVRVHFALHCATRSCPAIRAYDAEQIERQLDLAAHGFVSADVEIDPPQKVVRVSRIFRWFANDFGGRTGVLALLRRYLPDDERRQWLQAHERQMRFVYRPYDWGLNAAIPVNGGPPAS
jgi:hypothetical protein